MGAEKLSAVLNNAPATNIKLIAKEINGAVQQLAEGKDTISLIQKTYHPADLDHVDLVIAAVNDLSLAQQIHDDAHAKGLLVNAADKPELCDFYLSSIVQKGNLKIAISTNGKSPTLAKRLKEILNQTIPDEIETSLDNLRKIRQNLDGDFSSKVNKLNEITSLLITPAKKGQEVKRPFYFRKAFWKKLPLHITVFAGIMLFGYWIFGFIIPIHWLHDGLGYLSSGINEQFVWMFVAGFAAQLVDGAMGMGYGVLSTTFLLSANLPIPIAGISSSVHMAEMFSVGTAGISHYKYKHVNKKLWVALVVPGIIGAVLGAIFIGTLGKNFGNYLRPVVAIYTFYLGFRILKKSFKNLKAQRQRKLVNVRPVALIGGFLDAFGGGWGPLVTSTLISGGRDPLYTIGSSTFTKFFTSIASTATFIIVFNQMHFQLIAGLVIGGMLAAPIAAKLSGKIPLKSMFLAVGILVILCSLRVFYNAIALFF